MLFCFLAECAYTQSGLVFSLRAFRVYLFLFRANAAVSRSERMADQRFSPRVLTAALWADFQAGISFSICFRPLVVIVSSTRLPRPPPTDFTKPSRCNGRRFRTSVVRSIPSQSLNSAMFQLFLVCNDARIDSWVDRIPCRRISASKNCVTARVTQRRLKHTQFSGTEKSNTFDMVMCIYTP